MSALAPPKIQTEDPGTHDLEESSDDHYSSASEGANPTSPVPVTRVERVDDVPAHGEVPGTAAYAQRTQDAVPDEIEIVPEGARSRSGTRTRALSNLSGVSNGSRPGTPGGSPVPKTVVERVDGGKAYGEVEGTVAKEMRLADAEPDEVKRVDAREGRGGCDEQDGALSEEGRQAWFRSMWEGGEGSAEQDEAVIEDEQDDAVQEANQHDVQEADQDDAEQENEQPNDEDDFDDFAEEQEGGDDDDFGDFDDADDTPLAPEPQTQTQQQPPTPPNPLAHLPKLTLSTPPSKSTTLPAYLDAIFPPQPPSQQTPTSPPSATPFLSPRSLSLWQQLLLPPPMSPPNWTRSRIRRLFLVSLGVPVDLDEILPPSKQKRLVLPNINLAPPENRRSTHLDRLKSNASANASRTSLDSKGAPKKGAKRGTLREPPPPPAFDLNAAALVAATTEEALRGKEDGELREHVVWLREMNEGASRVLEYWLMRRDEGVREKEAFEGVVANLVGFVKGRRGGR